jgi:hypothetical protein
VLDWRPAAVDNGRREVTPVFQQVAAQDSAMEDREIARRSLDFQARSRDYRLLDIPGYLEWSRRKLEEGESYALIAHLDATSMCLLPEEVSQVREQVFDEMLDELRAEIEGRP